MTALKTYFRLLAEDRQAGPATKFLNPVLETASAGYGTVVSLLRQCHEKKILPRKRLPFPVVSVGNLTWGGSGKTPLVEYLARKISERHATPLVLTRGYSHDEIEQVRHHLPRVIIGVGKDRYSVAMQESQKTRIHVAFLDDGLQHWKIERDIEIIVVNALNPFGNEKLIPRGILREPLSALNRAHIVVISHVNLVEPEALEKLKNRIREMAPNAFIVESYLEPLFLYRAHRRKRVSIGRLQNQKVTTFSGVAMPQSFQMLLTKCQIRPTRNFEFTDHHDFSENELEEIKTISQSSSTEEIITTEKDFYRAPEKITKILNPLILATRLRIQSGEEVLTERLFRLLGVSNG